MKKIRIVLYFLLSIIFLNTSILPASAKESTDVYPTTNETSESVKEYSEKQLNKKLEKLGFPEELISNMHIDKKREIISNNPIEFAGYEKIEYNLDDNGKLQEVNPDDISIMGTIKPADLELVISKTYLGSYNGKRAFRIYVDWKWNIWTAFYWEDKIALSYNDIFQTRVSTNGNYYCQEYHSETPGGDVYPNGNCGGRPNDITFGGASWYIDKHQGYDEGYAAMDIETKVSGTAPISGILLAKYVHKTGFDGGIGLSIKYVDIYVTNTSGYDEGSVQQAFDY